MSGLERPEETVDWSAVETLAEVTGERDRARATAVRLEQELAKAEEYIRRLLPPLPSQIRAARGRS